MKRPIFAIFLFGIFICSKLGLGWSCSCKGSKYLLLPIEQFFLYLFVKLPTRTCLFHSAMSPQTPKRKSPRKPKNSSTSLRSPLKAKLHGPRFCRICPGRPRCGTIECQHSTLFKQKVCCCHSFLAIHFYVGWSCRQNCKPRMGLLPAHTISHLLQMAMYQFQLVMFHPCQQISTTKLMA